MLTDKFIHLHVPRTAGTTFRSEIAPMLDVKILERKAHRSYSFYSKRCEELGYDVPPSFAFIRNPWDWYVSLWGRVNKLKKWGWDGGSFYKYLCCVKDWGINHWNFKSLTYAWNAIGAGHAHYVGRFEVLRHDLPRILKAIMPETDEDKIRKRLTTTRRRETHHKPYQEYYTDEMRHWVAEWDKNLIERFGYTFF